MLIALPPSGSGPGLLLAIDGSDACRRTLAMLFADEGYVVVAPGRSDSLEAEARRLHELPEQTGKLAGLGFGTAAERLCRSAASAGLYAVAAYDPEGLAGFADIIAEAGIPATFQFGTKGAPSQAATAASCRDLFARHDGSSVHIYDDAAPGFGIPGEATFHKRLADIAHTATLRLLRRVVGPHYDFVALFEEHLRSEFVDRDAGAAIATMVAEPYVNHVPTMTGGVGRDLLHRFYKYHFVDQNSDDRENIPVSFTMDANRLVIESVARFTHDRPLDRYFPGIEPTGKTVELPIMISVKFRGTRVAHEHIYWDQGSALAQIGAIDASALPVSGAAQAAKILNETLPSNELMPAWSTSEGKPL